MYIQLCPSLEDTPSFPLSSKLKVYIGCSNNSLTAREIEFSRVLWWNIITKFTYMNVHLLSKIAVCVELRLKPVLLLRVDTIVFILCIRFFWFVFIRWVWNTIQKWNVNICHSWKAIQFLPANPGFALPLPAVNDGEFSTDLLVPFYQLPGHLQTLILFLLPVHAQRKQEYL